MTSRRLENGLRSRRLNSIFAIIGFLSVIRLIMTSTFEFRTRNLDKDCKANRKISMQDEYMALLKNALAGRTAAFNKKEVEKDPNALLSLDPNALLSHSHRMANIEPLILQVLEESVEGDFCECGTRLGGMSIYLAGFLAAHHELANSRKIWVADTFAGMPSDEGWWRKGLYKGTLPVVRQHFQNYNLLDEDRVQFVEGLFSDSLPHAPIQKLAFLHVDCDTYSATMDVLENLYPKMSRGGWIVFDDYHAKDHQRKAVLEYKEKMGITTEVEMVDIPDYAIVGNLRVE